MRSRGNSGRDAVKCPKCGVKIPLPGDPAEASGQAESSQTSERPATTKRDAELRRMLLRAKKKASDPGAPSGRGADRTVPDIAVPPDDTSPDYGMDQTMPMGRNAMTARDLGTSNFGHTERDDRRGAETIRRNRQDTPRAAAIKSISRGRPQPPPAIQRPVVDEPTYTGPMPGRTPHITPSGSDLSRFLTPGNYLVRVEESVYEPVSEKDLVRLLNAGVFFAIDELCGEDGKWIPISSPELFSDLKGRLAHRAHHMLARVVPPKPAAQFDRPADPDDVVAALDDGPTSAPSVIVDDIASTPEPPAGAAPTSRRKRLALLVVPLLGLLGIVFVGVVMLFVPNASDWASGLVASTPAEFGDDASSLTILSEEDAGVIDPVPAFQLAIAGIHSSYSVADSIDGMLNYAQEIGDDTAATLLAFEKWKRKPSSVDANPLVEKLMAREQWVAARQVANWVVVTHGASAELATVIETSLRRQFEAETVVDITTERFARLVRIDAGKRPTLILQDHRGTNWTVWLDLGQKAWRNDIAAYRLCQLMVCHFRIPETRQARIDKETFLELARSASDDSRDMAEKLQSDFDWDSDGGVKGSIREVPDGAPWPIELSQIWRPWLTAGSGLTKLDDDVEHAHTQVAFFGADKVYPELRGMNARQLARQVSSILLFDYLVNNWNRFAPAEENWGSRTRIDNGLIYSLEDSAAFSEGDSVRVRGRFSWSRRFSRATVESVKELNKDHVEEFLFPNATKDDKDKLEEMWKQRTRALRRINQLVKKYGADDVYALDNRPSR